MTSGHRDYAPNQILVVAGTKDERDQAVAAIEADEAIPVHKSWNHPALDTVELLQIESTGSTRLDFAVIRESHPLAFPNYVIAPMVHAEVLPINYPRPAKAPDNFNAPAAQANGSVEVVIIDSALIDGTPMAHGVTAGDKHRRDLNLGHGGDPVTINHVDDEVRLSDLHGTFVASIVQQLVPEATVRLVAMDNRDDDGFYSDWELAFQLMDLVHVDALPDVLSLSLGASAFDGRDLGLDERERPRATERALEHLRNAAATHKPHMQIVAAAGNDGQDVVYPAAFETVDAVGAQVSLAGGRPRPARWSSGSRTGGVAYWAPGVSILGATIKRDDVSFPPIDAPALYNVDYVDDLPLGQHRNLDFDGWAAWDGTSFATPVIAARLAKAMIDGEDLAVVAQEFGSPGNTTGFPGGGFPAPSPSGA